MTAQAFHHPCGVKAHTVIDHDARTQVHECVGKVQRIGMAQRHDQQGFVVFGEAHFHGGGVSDQGAGLVTAYRTFGLARGA